MYAQCLVLLTHQVTVRRITLLEYARSAMVIATNEKAQVLSLSQNWQDNLLCPPSGKLKPSLQFYMWRQIQEKMSLRVTTLQAHWAVQQKNVQKIVCGHRKSLGNNKLSSTHGTGELVVNEDNAGHIVGLNCTMCKTYADILRGMKNFSVAWPFWGSTNLRLNNVEDHARGEPHKRALDLHPKEEKCQSPTERPKAMGALTMSGQNLSHLALPACKPVTMLQLR